MQRGPIIQRNTQFPQPRIRSSNVSFATHPSDRWIISSSPAISGVIGSTRRGTTFAGWREMRRSCSCVSSAQAYPTTPTNRMSTRHNTVRRNTISQQLKFNIKCTGNGRTFCFSCGLVWYAGGHCGEPQDSPIGSRMYAATPLRVTMRRIFGIWARCSWRWATAARICCAPAI